jgi:glycine C-acetyltransferase
MSNTQFHATLREEVARIDAAKTSKRQEKVIEGFTQDHSPRAIIQGKKYLVFNSNDYLGLRFHPDLKNGERKASETYGTGPGAVRFISGTLQVYKDLEKALAQFHGRDDAMVFSSAFAANLAVMYCLIKGQAKDSLVSGDTLVISDSLNHRSIIDGIRIANLPKEQKLIYEHLNYDSLAAVLKQNAGRFTRVLVITDGIFSMLGEHISVEKLKSITKEYEDAYTEGVHLIVDDSHGVSAFGQTGRGVEDGTVERADVLVGTMGKGFGADGGYVTADQSVIDYFRESAASYIYSNSISPGVAGAALSAVKIVDSSEGRKLLQILRDNVALFKELVTKEGFQLAADSAHPIQPILIGDAGKCKELTARLFEKGILVTSINYPVVAAGRDEIRVQITAVHTAEDIRTLVTAFRETHMSP